MLSDADRVVIEGVRSIGPYMIGLLEQAGIGSLANLQMRSAADLHFQIEVETGVRLNRNGMKALENLVAAVQELEGK